MNIKYLFTLFLMFNIHILFSQNPLDTVLKSRKTIELAVSTKVGGASFFGIAFDLYVYELANVELVRTPTGFGIGGYYHFNPFRKFDNYTLYIGFSKAKYRIRLIDKYHYGKLYFPIGINYKSNKEYLNLAIDIGYVETEINNDGYSILGNKESGTRKRNGISASLKVGFRF